MNNDKIERLINQLNSYIDMNGSRPFISPTSPMPSGNSFPLGSMSLKKKTDFSSMTKNELLLAHCLLHKFYATGNKKLNKEDLKSLHNEILPYLEEHMVHERFDKLDDR